MKAYLSAIADLKRAGTARATGDAFRAMLALLIRDAHGGDPSKYYAAIRGQTEAEMRLSAAPMLQDRATAWDALMA